MKSKLYLILVLLSLKSLAQSQKENSKTSQDSIKKEILKEVVVTASRTQETFLRSPISIEQLKSADAKNMGSPSCFDALENLKEVQIITPSLGFKVINTRGFANTTNVRFAQLVDDIDNQAPHLGAPIANALGANDLDIDKIEVIPGAASALYGMNAINGLANIQTKNPFEYEGLSIQQLTGVNHVGHIDRFSPQLYNQTNLRYAKAINSRIAFKINGSTTAGTDWIADNRTDLAPNINASTNLYGADNPAFDEVNGYGNESANRRTLTLNGKKYVVSRTGYRETDIADYNIQNYKGDVGLYFRPKKDQELAITYKGALINTVYQRSNRFRLEDYTLNQYSIDYHTNIFQIRTYLTQENTGKSYNMRSLAENMDRAFKSDDQWFANYTTAYNNAVTNGTTVADAHRMARATSDQGRFIPGTDAYNQKKAALVNTNNWDFGAALRVKSSLVHAEGLFNWDKAFADFFKKIDTQLLSGFDYRTYIIVPDGNYFINPVDDSKNLTYGKTGGFTQLSKDLFDKKLRLSATLRADKADFFDLKFTPRFTAVFSPKEEINFRASYQSGYRFPSIFEGFSNVNSGGVKRVGGLRIMSDGIFENSYTKASIDKFQAQVTSDINTLGLTQAAAIDKNKGIIQKNPYTYLRPEFVRSFEFGFRGVTLNKSLFIDTDFYYNSYANFIAQVEASIPNTADIPTALYSKNTQSRYRLWTNSKSKIYNYGGSLGLKYKYNNVFSFLGNVTYTKLDRTDDKDGLEDGFNTPKFIVNGTVITENLWKNLGASITYRYQNKYDYVSFLVSGEVPAYWSMDAQVNYNFKKPGVTAKLGGTNFLNKTYYSMLGGPSIGGLYYLSLTWDVGKI
ncbi:TonB-dependent receptor [Flavobacterium gawalongense]|uniref:TonB-dependent receptor n=1 Tax=Flavobacterium gawalongense TaxID=2594432 RepID=A0A553BLV5_9FLAO|nr:TonB-dependent receptor [Flavobacterium gawalongense]TRX09135.1 TonB-dependent receptor [Flavobacterium gawalongense]TRX09230.1 TonB-dependent receptor [Flavobacterium gawalongense]TRX26687.1 TonB-dependent receptor [Flavobacterium gawalongense]